MNVLTDLLNGSVAVDAMLREEAIAREYVLQREEKKNWIENDERRKYNKPFHNQFYSKELYDYSFGINKSSEKK